MKNRASNKVLSLALAATMMLSVFAAPPMTAYAVDIGTKDNMVVGGIVLGTASASPTVIGFGGNQWAVIGYDGVGDTTPSDTVTLLLANGQSYGNSAFRTGSNTPFQGSTQFLGDNWYYADNPSGPSWTNPNEYYGSTLQAGNNIVTTLSSGEQALLDDLVIPCDFAGGAAYNDNSDNVAGNPVYDAYFWPLSVNEANQVNSIVRQFGDNWWLRSPGDDGSTAAYVGYHGYVYAAGFSVGIFFAIRPAFKLNLSSVIFTSAAAGGKSVTAGDTLESVPKAPTDEIKLTVEDNMNLSLTSVTSQSVSGRTITFDYVGATAGETLSAIAKIGNDIKYYGQLKTSIIATDSASVTVPDDVTATDKLLIFIEQINGNNFTDFACTPVPLAFNTQAVPTVQGVACTTGANNDGQITGTDGTMEYSADGNTWATCGNSETTGLTPDNYLVRVKGKVDSGTAYLASDAQTVTVGAYTPPGTVATPTANPAGGAVAAGTQVTLSCSEPGAAIHYTTDGSTPTTSSNTYNSPITVNSAMTVKAIAVKSGMIDSAVMTVSYTISASPPSRDRDSGSDSDSGRSYTPPVVTVPSTLIVDAARARTALAEREKSGANRARIRHNWEIKVLPEAWSVFGNVPVDFDTVDDGAVQVRVTVREPGKMTGEKLLSGYVKGSIVDSRKAFFEKWYKNKIQVIHFDQQGSFGQPVEIAAKLDLTGMDTENLYFCSYDRKTNTYKRIEKPAYWIDKNGYLHFTTEYAGDIIISEGALTPKGQNTK